MAALQIVPAGARQIAPGVFQQIRRRSGGAPSRGKSKHKAGGKHGFFAKQWVWFAFALMLGEVAQRTIFKNSPAWLSVPALILYAYGTAKKKPGAINAAYALQGARLLAYFGVTGTVTGLAAKAMGGGGWGALAPQGASNGGGLGLGSIGDVVDVDFDSRTIGNATKNVADIAAAVKVVAAMV